MTIPIWKKKSGAEYWSTDGRFAIVRQSRKHKAPGWYIYERVPPKKRKLLGGPYSFQFAKVAANILILRSQLAESRIESNGQKD